MKRLPTGRTIDDYNESRLATIKRKNPFRKSAINLI